MCGIAGIMHRPGVALDQAMLAQFAASLAHRGPDGSGVFETGNTALVHTRLAIIDLVSGDQPLRAGPLTLVANGEIYNFSELRAALPVTYSTKSDCESPLRIFARNSANYTADLRGMYGIAIHDFAFGTLTLSRDPFGIKPLYYGEYEGGLAFASEPQALLDAGIVARDVDAGKLQELLQLQFCTGVQSIFPGIFRMAPGETLTVKEGRIVNRTVQAAIQPASPPANEAEALRRLDAVLENAVEMHQRADVPYGLFLSGGIDSAAVLAMMARLNSSPVLAYTAGFDVPGVADERDAAAHMAQAAGAKHQRVNITEDMVWAHLPEIVAAMDDPVADYAIIPSWFLARAARKDVKVILSGEGGDEMFAGYGRYRAASRWFFPKKMRSRGVFDGLDVLRTPPSGWRDGIAKAEADAKGVSRLQAAQRSEIAEWLPNDLLLKLDRCLMAHGIEGRTPLVDREVAAFAFSLPSEMLVRNGQGKFLLRQWLAQNFPAANPFGKKQGFDVPIGAWIAAHAAVLGELVSRQPIIMELAEPALVRELFAQAGEKRQGFAAWVLLFTALWHRRHVLGLPCDGSVFDVLQ
jgi:asparagine synthase (glutamine-hydrolysing)